MAASDLPINSTAYYLAYSSDSGTTVIKVGLLTTKSLTRGMEPREYSNTDSSGNSEFGEGKKNWSLSGEFFPLYDAATGAATEADLHTLWSNRSKVRWYLATANVGDDQYYGDGYITQLDTSGGFEDNLACSISIQGTGALTSETIS